MLILYFLTFFLSLHGQQKKPITLEEIFLQNTFQQNTVRGINWMKNGEFYTSLVSDSERKADFVLKYNIRSGEVVDTLVNGTALFSEGNNTPLRFDEYALSGDETKILLATEKESIYRRSSKAYFYLYDINTKKLQKLTEGEKQSYASFSPDGSKIAFTRSNNLYYVDLATGREHEVTNDGKWNELIHGSADWVYEEEFMLSKAFYWSPDNNYLAYFSFDESDVKEYNMQLWGDLYPEDYKFKYPKAGEKNSEISISIYHLDTRKTVRVDLGEEKDIYIPRLYWTGDPSVLSVVRMNRLQNRLEILHADVNTGKTKKALIEENSTYVDINFIDDLTYLNNGKQFIRTSERDGYKHLYLHNVDGSLVRQITQGTWEVEQFLGYNEESKKLYYLSTEVSPFERHLYSIDVSGKNKKNLSKEAGVNSANLSSDFQYYINYHSSPDSPLTVSLHEAKSGKLIKIMEDNKKLKETLQAHQWNDQEFFTLPAPDGQLLNAYIIKPTDFDENKKYPLLMYVYGGPGSQEVVKNWASAREFWARHLAQQGYIVACVDNRGTGGRGKAFKDITYAQLGKYESEDQIAAAKYFAGLSYIDERRIGIWGWSYGGYMSSLALFIGNDVFKAAIAVAPVTSWRFYDTIYTERYLKTPQQNPDGYDLYSPLSHAGKLKGNYLLIHGTGDDNVHFQNSIALSQALIEANKQFDTFYYPNKNHGIYGGNTSFHLYQKMTEWLKDNL